MIASIRRLALALATLLVFVPPALAAETITSYDSATTLLKDGSVDVVETIDVNAEGDRIRHGIFRDVFTVLRNDDGSKYYADFHVVSVERDGHREPYTTGGINNGEQIKIGSADTIVTNGPHRYVIHYTMSRMARYFADHDELFWNATGNFWEFPIEKATAHVKLPDGAKISQVVAYQGPMGSHEAGQASFDGNTASFASTRVLGLTEGLTFAVSFQKGIVAGPSGVSWLTDRRDAILPVLAVLVVFAVNFYAWLKVGRDPKTGTIIPRFHPPEGLSPAAVQWVSRLGFKGGGWNALTADLFGLGAKGLVTIDNSAKTLSVAGTGKEPAEPLKPDEAVLYQFFGGDKQKTIDKSTGPSLNTTRSSMLSAITQPNANIYFRNNYLYILGCVAVAAAMIGLMVLTGVLDAAWIGGLVPVIVVVGVGVMLMRNSSTGPIFGSLFGAIGVMVALANIFGGSIHAVTGGFGIGMPVIGAVSIALLTVLFALIMRAPTPRGREVMDEIAGFKMYLNTAEKNRLNLEGEPPLSISRFEGLLPFAIALGVEKPWSDRFAAALAAGAVVGASGVYSPIWYSGHSFSSNSISNSVAALSSSMSAAMAASIPQSSSSSGFSSSGGGSGGGGGGGGGGGW
jgi:uncharacterized membrane protein YgcG